MTDRELLEKAAKAAGWSARQSAFRANNFVVEFEPDSWTAWNPLTDDGDALRLAVKLGLVVAAHKNYAIVSLPYEGEALCHVPIAKDPYAATRRAIVRAAAAMDERKPQV